MFKNLERFQKRNTEQQQPTGPDPLLMALNEIDKLKAEIERLKGENEALAKDRKKIEVTTQDVANLKSLEVEESPKPKKKPRKKKAPAKKAGE